VTMTPRERVVAALHHQPTDRVPRFEIWIDAFVDRLGGGDAARAYVDQGQDGVLLPSVTPAESHAWRTGTDEWGRVWRDGMYITGVVDTAADLAHYSPPADYADRLFDPAAADAVRRAYPDHCLFFGTHVGPLTAAYLAMGFERFFLRLTDDPAFVHALLAARTAWCIALFRRAVDLGAEVLVMGDDMASGDGPLLSPRMAREFVLPYHRAIVSAFADLGVPVIWHSDGDIRSLLPLAVEAGFVGVHGLEPAAGVDLAAVKRDYGRDLALIGNVDVAALSGSDLGAVRREVERCLAQGAPGGGYLIASCNSIFSGLNPDAVAELFRCEAYLTAG
jgi:uroporphyrinogen decarboxylase